MKEHTQPSPHPLYKPGPYFSRYLEDSSEQLGSASEVRNVLEEVQMEVIKNSLHKLYLEDFYRVCQVGACAVGQLQAGLGRVRE